MTARQYRAVIEHAGQPKTLEVIATGSKEHCSGALAAWRSLEIANVSIDDTALIVVEVTE